MLGDGVGGFGRMRLMGRGEGSVVWVFGNVLVLCGVSWDEVDGRWKLTW